MCWVRLQGPACNLFIIAVYLPHEQRTQPAIDDTLTELEAACNLAGKQDCIVIMGDFNVQLPGKLEKLTGSHVCATEETVGASKVLDLMRRHELCAADTMFRKRKGPTTFLRKISDKVDTNDQYVGRQVKTNWKGRTIYGEVVQNYSDNKNERRWRVRFEDDYVKVYAERELLTDMVVLNKETEGRQLDYILVSRRWFSCVKDAGVRWGPSEHRNQKGRADHGLVYCKWKWRIQGCKGETKKDYKQLLRKDGVGAKLREKFDASIKEKLAELGENISVDDQYDNMVKAISYAVKTTLPDKKAMKGVKREVSERTRQLYEQRTNMGRAKKKKWTNQDFEKVQNDIRKSVLKDFNDWVEECAQDMQQANNVGDTRKL